MSSWLWTLSLSRCHSPPSNPCWLYSLAVKNNRCLYDICNVTMCRTDWQNCVAATPAHAHNSVILTSSPIWLLYCPIALRWPWWRSPEKNLATNLLVPPTCIFIMLKVSGNLYQIPIILKGEPVRARPFKIDIWYDRLLVSNEFWKCVKKSARKKHEHKTKNVFK